MTSELLSHEQLDELIEAATRAASAQGKTAEPIDDELIARQAVELEYINLWQAEQMSA